MDVQPLTDEPKRHRIAFYQSALTLFAKQANNATDEDNDVGMNESEGELEEIDMDRPHCMTFIQFSRAKVLAVAEPVIDDSQIVGDLMLDPVEVMTGVPVATTMIEDTNGLADGAMAIAAGAKALAAGEEEMINNFEAELSMSSWEMNYANDKEVFAVVENTLLGFAALMSIREKHVVMWNLEDDDPSDVRNFIPGYLVKISNSVYEIVDDKDDICFATVAMEGEDGLKELWGTIVKFPLDEFVELA